jgi:phosphohistidine phosphatase
MAKQLWFLRHGDAEPHGARPDFDRRLTEKGERQSKTAGAALKRLGVEFHIVFTSPRIRALDTAKLACESLGCEPVVHEPLSGGFDADDAIELVEGLDEDGCILVVGHEPDFTQTIRDLTGGRTEMKKGGVAAVRVERRTGTLLMLMRPAELRAIAG